MGAYEGGMRSPRSARDAFMDGLIVRRLPPPSLGLCPGAVATAAYFPMLPKGTLRIGYSRQSR